MEKLDDGGAGKLGPDAQRKEFLNQQRALDLLAEGYSPGEVAEHLNYDQPALGIGHVARIEFDTHEATAHPQRDLSGGSRTDERIEDQVAGSCRERKAGFNELRGKHGLVGMLVRLGVDVPNGAQVAVIGIASCLVIIGILFAPGEQE